MKKLLLIILFIPAIALAENPNSFTDKASGIEFVFVKGGCYMMGGTSMSYSEPVHEVCVDSFHLLPLSRNPYPDKRDYFLCA